MGYWDALDRQTMHFPEIATLFVVTLAPFPSRCCETLNSAHGLPGVAEGNAPDVFGAFTRRAWGLLAWGARRAVRGGWIFSGGNIGQKLDSLQIQSPNCDGSKPAWRNRMQEVLTEANPQLLLLHPPFLGTFQAQNTRGWRRKLSRGSRLGWGVFCDVEEMLAFRKRGRKKKKGQSTGNLFM